MAQNKTTKFISGLLIVSMILPVMLFSIPKKAQAAWPVTDWLHTTITNLFGGNTSVQTTMIAGIKVKELARDILEQILKTIAKRILAKMTQSIINWINSDFHGAPLFIENPGRFFEDIAKTQVRQIVDMIGYDPNGFPFGRQIALGIIDSYKRQLNINARYTLSNVINDPDLLARYRTDFNLGGWNGFLINTQYPQNNYLGFNMMIQDSLMQKLAGTAQAPAEKVQSLLQEGMGFLSPQMCADNGGSNSYNNGVNEFQKPTFTSKVVFVPPADEPANTYFERDKAARAAFQNAKDAERTAWNAANTCKNLVSTTPGSVAANQVMMALGSSLRATELDAAVGNSLAAIFDALLNHFMDKGLNMLSDTVRSVTGGENDNWSYDGNSYSGSTSTSGTSVPPLNIPQNVSLRVGETVSTIISGGTAPYAIKTGGNPAIENTQISTSSSSGPKLIVTGITPGQTFIIVKDSSNPEKAVTVQISVNALGALAVNPHSILTDTSHPITATISGGIAPYTLLTTPNESIAVTAFSGANLVIVGVTPGQTAVAIKDSSVPAKTVVVPITISGITNLAIPTSIIAKVGETKSIAIADGTAPYSILAQIQLQETIVAATAQISDNNFNVTGVATGQTTVVVQDSSNPPKTATTSIQITAN